MCDNILIMSLEDRKVFLIKIADEMAATSNYTTSQGYKEYLKARKRLENIIIQFIEHSNRNKQFIDSIIKITDHQKLL